MNLSNHIPTIFWVLWAIECAFLLWWTWSDLRLGSQAINPAIYWAWLWLIGSLVLYLCQIRTIALLLVGVAAIPLAIMAAMAIAVFIAQTFFGPIRWN